MSEHRVWIPIKPQVKERARFRSRKRGGPYTPDKTVEFEKAVRRAWTDNHLEGPLGVVVEIHSDGFWVTVYETMESVRPVGVLGDIDNYLKSLFDGLQPHKSDEEGGLGAFANDKQIERVEAFFVGVPRKTVQRRVQRSPHTVEAATGD